MTAKKRATLTELLTGDEILEKASTREALLGHGIRMFHREGVDGTTIGRLLKVAGKSKSQFYSHFTDRDDFVCKILELQMTTILSVTRRVKLEKVSVFWEWFSPYVELAKLPENLGCPVGPLATDLSPSNEKIRREAASQLRRWQAAITEDLTILAANNGFPPDFDPAKTALQLCCSIQGAYLFCRVHQKSSFIEEVGERYFQEFRALLNST